MTDPNAKLDSEPDMSSVPVSELLTMIQHHTQGEKDALTKYQNDLRTHQYWRNFYQRELNRRQVKP